MSRLHVCSLADMPGYASELRPGRVITLLQPEWQPPTPSEIDPENHYRVVINDITEPSEDQILPTREHVEGLVGFLRASRESSLLVHCYAGVSRSTAAALIAMVLDAPGRERDAARAMRSAAPYAQPNRLIIRHADELLDRRGALVAALAVMGPAEAVSETPGLLTLPRNMNHL
jgi:predicted protein tyrosine phosphatase